MSDRRRLDGLAPKIVSVHEMLDSLNVPHQFGGAIALAWYRSPRATTDIDLNITMSPGDASPVLGALAHLGVTVTEADEAAAATDDVDMTDQPPTSQHFAGAALDPESKARRLHRFLGPLVDEDESQATLWRGQSDAAHAEAGAQLSDLAAQLAVQTGRGKDRDEMFPGLSRFARWHATAEPKSRP